MRGWGEKEKGITRETKKARREVKIKVIWKAVESWIGKKRIVKIRTRSKMKKGSRRKEKVTATIRRTTIDSLEAKARKLKETFRWHFKEDSWATVVS